MKLITETILDVQYIAEATEEGKKNVFIEGIFMQAEQPNRNGRVYRKNILENVLTRFQPLIEEKRALGELGHPPTPQINLDKVSHLISSLRFEGNNIHGRAKILDTPNGRIAKNFIEEGVKLGVSSRGLGTLKEGSNGIMEVQNDFHLATVDIVADPSANDAFVQGIFESAEWLYVEGRGYVITNAQKSIDNIVKETKIDRSLREERFLKVMQQFFNQIK